MSDFYPNLTNTDVPTYNSVVIDRQELHKTLEQSRHHRVTLVSSPPGYGKTMTVAQFIRHSHLPAAWHSLQEIERDLYALYRHSLQSLEFVASSISTTVAYTLQTADECAAYIADYMREYVRDHIFYVLDDLQFIAGSPKAEWWLRDLIRQMPETCHLILISRELPGLPIAELVANSEILTIGQKQLKFTLADARALADRLDVTVQDDVLQRRIKQFEGWPVGIAMALRPPSADLQTGSPCSHNDPAALFDTLADRLLDTLPPTIRQFLLIGSIASRVTPQLCREALGLPNAGVIITEIMRRHLFASHVSGGLILHRLFRNFLQQRLQQIDPKLFAQLHTRAGDWYRTQYQDDEAFYHYIMAEDIKAALAVVAATHRAYYKQGHLETLLRWRMTLGEHAEALPEFIYTCAMILTNRYLYKDAIDELNRAENGFYEQQNRPWIAEVQLQRAMIHIWMGEYQVAHDLALPIAREDRLSVPTVSRARHLLALIEMATGDMQTAITELKAILPVFETLNESYYLSLVLQDLQVAHARLGDVDASSYYLQRLVSIRRRFGQSGELALALNNLGDHYHQSGNYDLALQTLNEGLQIIEATANRRTESYLCWTMADLQRDLGNDEQAQRFYERAHELSKGSEPALQQEITFSIATFYRLKGDHHLALHLIQDIAYSTRPNDISPKVAAAQAVLEGLIEDKLEVLDALDTILQDLQSEAPTIVHLQVVLPGIMIAAKYNDDERLSRYLDICEALVKQSIGHNLIAAELLNVPDVLLVLTSHYNALANVVQRLQKARQILGQTDEPLVTSSSVSGATYHLRVLTLGQEVIERDGNVVLTSEWRSSKAREFFLYLLFNGATRREEIGLIFWPDSDVKRLRSSFHTTLYRTRCAVGENVILYEDDRYSINPSVSVWCDAKVFASYVQEAQTLGHANVRADDLYRKSLSYYQGDFLPTMNAEWIVRHRATLHDQYIRAQIGSGHCALVRRDYQTARVLFKQAIDGAPYREDAYRALFACYAEMGERSLLLKRYQQMIRLFETELGIYPSPETCDYVQQLTE